jgi:Ca2+-binding EF-hand superfamily protein
MLDKMGLKVNQNEANMLLVCIDENGDNRVTANEFLDLVFTHNDGLMNIDTTKNGGLIDGSSSAVFDEIKKNAERVKKLKPMNQWKLFLQKNLNNIALDLLAVDSDRKYSVDYKDFMKVIDRRAKIPEYLKQENSDLLYEFIGEYT